MNHLFCQKLIQTTILDLGPHPTPHECESEVCLHLQCTSVSVEILWLIYIRSFLVSVGTLWLI